MRNHAWLAAGLVAALAMPDSAILKAIHKLRAEGASWSEIGQTLAAADSTGTSVAEVVELRRRGDWRWVRSQLAAQAGEKRRERKVIPDRQDEEQWQRGGFNEPGAERQRAPGQPGTVSPAESLLPPGGRSQPGGEPHPPVRPSLPE